MKGSNLKEGQMFEILSISYSNLSAHNLSYNALQIQLNYLQETNNILYTNKPMLKSA
jgi:hypothetical protein